MISVKTYLDGYLQCHKGSLLTSKFAPSIHYSVNTYCSPTVCRAQFKSASQTLIPVMCVLSEFLHVSCALKIYPSNFSKSINSPRIRDGSRSLGILTKKHYWGGGEWQFTDKCKNSRGKCHILLAEKRALTKLRGHTTSVLMGHHSGLQGLH